MFNKLVVSTNEKRGKRTATFFFGTSIIYLTAVAFAFAISILAADPRMADASETILLALSRPPDAKPPEDRSARPGTQVAQRQDLNNVQDLEHLMSQPSDAARQIPPQVGDLSNSSDWGEGVHGGGGDGVPEGLSNGVEISKGGDGEVAPPPDAPKPITQTRTEDNRQPVKLTSIVLQGKATMRRAPDYPPLARQIRLEDSVSVEVMIGLDGHVESARAVSGHPMLVTAAVNAARGWRFEPTLLNGAPVRVTGIIVFNFKLN
ncbi:MAG TPA: TonB family protein [Blastocatellia bacterium]|jgi:protein TonB|nr:TonB family protein [Blastocatellia bacterium]